MNSFLVFHAALENPYNNRACIAEYTVIVVSRKYRLYVSVCLCVCVVIISAEAGSLHISRVFALHSNPLSACPYIWVRLRIESDRANVLHPHEIIVAVRFHTYAPRAHSLRRCVLSFFLLFFSIFVVVEAARRHYYYYYRMRHWKRRQA